MTLKKSLREKMRFNFLFFCVVNRLYHGINRVRDRRAKIKEGKGAEEMNVCTYCKFVYVGNKITSHCRYIFTYVSRVK